MKRPNEIIRRHARQNDVRLYELAEEIGISENTLIRRLRKQLSDDVTTRYMEAIDKIARDNIELVD